MHPREFGKFRILKLLPKGGMGTVYLALNTQSQEEVALKLIELGPDLDRQEIAAAERRGALLQRQLCTADQRIAQIREFGELEEFFFIEMEYVAGQDLSELLRTGPLGVPFAARIGIDLCEVLNLTHNFHAVIDGISYAGVVHGDIKPRNIRITPDGELRVLDFGIAKALSLSRAYTRILFGSPQYSSPERLNSGDITVASDLWAVGVVLWEVITAQPYFSGETGERLEHTIRNYRSLRRVPASTPPAFAAILRKSLHPNPADRYQTAAEFRDDLRAYLERKPTVAESEGLADADSEATRRTFTPADTRSDEPTRRTLPPPPPGTPFTPVHQTRVRVRAGKRVLQFIAGAMLVCAATIAWFIWHEWNIWSRGNELAQELQSDRLTDLNAAFVRYQALQDSNQLPLVLRSPRSAILDKLTASADKSLGEYRDSEVPTLREGDWTRSLAALNKALQVVPGDREIRGKIALCEAHLARIRGTSRQSSKLLNEARLKFEEAHALLPHSPDPYVGLASLYAYSLNDVDRAEDAIKQADKRGHKIGRREKGQLADCFRARAERLIREADKASGLPEERDYLERADSDLKSAQDLYRDIAPFGSSTSNLSRAARSSENVQLRLKSIREGA